MSWAPRLEALDFGGAEQRVREDPKQLSFPGHPWIPFSEPQQFRLRQYVYIKRHLYTQIWDKFGGGWSQ